MIQEEFAVGKREVERRGVRVRSRIVERPVEEAVRLRGERVSVERRPVNRPVTDEDIRLFREGTFEVTERAEVPVVANRRASVEEVSVNKEVGERTETVGDTVIRTDVEVEEVDTPTDTRKSPGRRGARKAGARKNARPANRSRAGGGFGRGPRLRISAPARRGLERGARRPRRFRVGGSGEGGEE